MIGQDNADVDGQDTACDPPADRVSKEVDLLAGGIVGPEADTAQQEGPLVGQRSIGVAASQLVVVPEHGPLQLKPLAQERERLDLPLYSRAANIICRKGRDILDKPDVGAGCNLLVTIDLLLLEGPLGERLGVRPHSNLARVVDELEVAGNTLELLLGLAVFNANLKQSHFGLLSVRILPRDGGELLVGGVVGRCNVVRQQVCIRDQVTESD